MLFQDAIASQGDAISTAGDVSSVLLEFDISTGAYQVTWTADPANPFNGEVSLVLNLKNDTIGGGLAASLNGTFNITSATTLTYSGTASALTDWQIGDTIATFESVHQGPCPLCAFHSALMDVDGDTSVSNRDLVKTSSDIQ